MRIAAFRITGHKALQHWNNKISRKLFSLDGGAANSSKPMRADDVGVDFICTVDPSTGQGATQNNYHKSSFLPKWNEYFCAWSVCGSEWEIVAKQREWAKVWIAFVACARFAHYCQPQTRIFFASANTQRNKARRKKIVQPLNSLSLQMPFKVKQFRLVSFVFSYFHWIKRSRFFARITILFIGGILWSSLAYQIRSRHSRNASFRECCRRCHHCRRRRRRWWLNKIVYLVSLLVVWALSEQSPTICIENTIHIKYHKLNDVDLVYSFQLIDVLRSSAANTLTHRAPRSCIFAAFSVFPIKRRRMHWNESIHINKCESSKFLIMPPTHNVFTLHWVVQS